MLLCSVQPIVEVVFSRPEDYQQWTASQFLTESFLRILREPGNDSPDLFGCIVDSEDAFFGQLSSTLAILLFRWRQVDHQVRQFAQHRERVNPPAARWQDAQTEEQISRVVFRQGNHCLSCRICYGSVVRA
jgi:hypothetical protein